MLEVDAWISETFLSKKLWKSQRRHRCYPVIDVTKQLVDGQPYLPWLGLLLRNESLPESLTFAANEVVVSAQLRFPHGLSGRRLIGASFYTSAVALGVATVVIEPRI